MWSPSQQPSRLERQGSFHSVVSDRSSDASSDEFVSYISSGPNVPAMWTARPSRASSNVLRLSEKFGNTTISAMAFPQPPTSREQSTTREGADDDLRSRSSTLGGDEEDYEYPEKTPTPDSIPKKLMDLAEEIDDREDEVEKLDEPAPIPHVPGPLELQLQALMSKLVFIEQENPTISITPNDYDVLQSRVEALESEKRIWQQRHEALFALRDEDVGNIIKTRGLLAKTRRDLEGMTKLRDDDLINLQAVRARLAEATRKLERQEVQSSPVTGRFTPTRGRPSSMMLERRDTTDLFAAAKAAALEQRALELEKRNQDLLVEIESLKSGTPSSTVVSVEAPKSGDISIDSVNRMAAHKAWKATVADMEAKLRAKDAEIAVMRAGGAPGASPGQSVGIEWHRVEALHEEHATYREKVGSKMQLLRIEKEMLQKELHRKEDECHDLEVKLQSLQRKVNTA